MSSPIPPDGVVLLPGETPTACLARYTADYHSANAAQIIADLTVWIMHIAQVVGPIPDGAVALPGETPMQTYARYKADYHSSNAVQVVADLLTWASGGAWTDIGPCPISGQILGETPTEMLVRFVADYHAPDASAVIAKLDAWLAGPTRPVPVQQPVIAPPFDASDPGGIVHTTLPFTPPPNPTKDFHRGDAWGVTLDPSLSPPLVPGCNTTPLQMMMSYLFPFYARNWQDIQLTAHAVRSYSHFHLDQWNWQSAGLSPAQAAALMQYIQSWGFYTTFWGLGTRYGVNWSSWAQAEPYLQPILSALIAAGPTVCENTVLVVGEELNSCTSPAGLLDIVTNLSPICAGAGIDLWLHLTDNYRDWSVDGNGVGWWQQMKSLGVKGLKWQGDVNDPAGTMGAHMWDARSEMAQADPSLLVCAFEYLGDRELYGQVTEQQACLRGFELVCCPTGAPTPNAPYVAGYGGGGCLPDGLPL